MRRRTLLQSLAAAPAVAAFNVPALQAQAPAAASIENPRLATSVPDAIAEPLARFFTADQFAALSRLADLLEPAANQTPGARDARVPEFLDFLLSQSPAPRQKLYRTGLDRLNADAATRFRHPFSALDDTQAAAILEPLHRPWTFEDSADPLERFLRAAKDDVLQATRNSYEFISVVSKRSRGASGVGEFWYPLY